MLGGMSLSASRLLPPPGEERSERPDEFAVKDGAGRYCDTCGAEDVPLIDVDSACDPTSTDVCEACVRRMLAAFGGHPCRECGATLTDDGADSCETAGVDRRVARKALERAAKR